MPGLPTPDIARRGIEVAKRVATKPVEKARAIPERTNQVVQKLEGFQNRHPILGLRLLGELESNETRSARVLTNVSEKTDDLPFNTTLAAYRKAYPGLSEAEIQANARQDIARQILEKANRRDFRAIEALLVTPGRPHLELSRIENELREQIPGIKKDRKKLLARLAAIVAGIFVVETGKSSSSEELRAA